MRIIKMAGLDIKNELKAIETITEVLKPLDNTAQRRVLQYAMQHLGLQVEQTKKLHPTLETDKDTELRQPILPLQKGAVDIRQLRDQKQPNSDMEMAAIVAYYLSELAPEEDRKEAIGTADMKKYFKQAGHPLPKGLPFTLPNAKAAGYFESAGYGKYKLNPVGYNLVVHGLPRAKGGSILSSPRKKNAKKAK